MTNDTRGASTLWILLLTLASTLTTLAFACATPFAALATLAAVHMRRRDGIALVLLCWLASQAVGFGVLHYPHDARTLAWGVAIGGAGFVAVLGADAVARLLATRGFAPRLIAAFVAALLGFKAIIALASTALGGGKLALSLPILADQVVRNGAMLVGLLVLYRLLVTLGVPAARAPQRTATA